MGVLLRSAAPLLLIIAVVALLDLVHGAPAFISSARSTKVTGVDMSSDANNNKPCQQWPPAGHPSTLPGDPSLILTTNVDLGDKKMDIMKAFSKAISAATGKPESYIAVSVTDNASMIFGGSDAPLALGCMYSIGAIAMESNGQVQASVTEQLAPFGVTGDRIYINFFVSLFNLISCSIAIFAVSFRVSCSCNQTSYLTYSHAFCHIFMFTKRNSGCTPGERWLEWCNLRWLIESI